jgi:hypothetical protein
MTVAISASERQRSDPGPLFSISYARILPVTAEVSGE